MKQDLLNYKDYLIQLLCLLSQHSLGNYESRHLKDKRLDYAFEILYFLNDKLQQNSFETLVFSDQDIFLYTYSETSISKLQKKQLQQKDFPIYLCTSIKPDLPLKNSIERKYHYHYKLKLKANTFGIDLLKVVSQVSKKDQKNLHNLLYGKTPKWHLIHEIEHEVIIKLSDIDTFEEVVK